jgi:hypothetical protein
MAVKEDTAMSRTASACLDVRTLLRALGDGWQAYLPAVSELSEEERQAYLEVQGYERVRDLLAHATAWGEETLGVVPVLLRGGEVPRNDADAFNAQALARFSLYSEAEVERRFAQANAALSRLLAVLPESALERPSVYKWLTTTIVEHFNEHRPPNMAAVP